MLGEFRNIATISQKEYKNTSHKKKEYKIHIRFLNDNAEQKNKMKQYPYIAVSKALYAIV